MDAAGSAEKAKEDTEEFRQTVYELKGVQFQITAISLPILRTSKARS